MSAMSEAEMQEGIEHALTLGGWRWHHDEHATLRSGSFAVSHRGQSGFPDIVAVNPERKALLVLELKSDTGRTSPLQDDWLEAFRLAGVDARVVTPAAYDELVKELVGDRLLAARGGTR